jgi:hypothetical protein
MSSDTQSESAVAVKPKVLTEDLGKIFEMAICLASGIEYDDGEFKYNIAEAHKLASRVAGLSELFNPLKHTAKKQNRFDFQGIDLTTNEPSPLSAKSVKKDGKVCPQVIGQPTKRTFCKHFGLDETTDVSKIKEHIISNIIAMLFLYSATTFDAPILYYNKHTSRLSFIKQKTEIDWNAHIVEFLHITKNKTWNESTTIKIGGIAIGEFQVHNHRNCVKFRWMFEKLLAHPSFCDHFDVVELP